MKKVIKPNTNNQMITITCSYSELYDLREFCRFYKAIQPQLSNFTNMETEELLKSSKKLLNQIEGIMNNGNK